MIIGIDLGTTNSAAAYWADGAPVLIPNRLGELLTPSAVGLDDDGGLLVGRPARERMASHAGLTATAFKRYMGTQHRVTLGRKDYGAEELSAMVLRSLKEDAEAHLGQAVTEAVITVPAYFNDKQRKATRRAGELAGLKVERLINEPTAAALAYGIHQLAGETRFLVFDLGGGTFDVSVLEIFEGVIEVRASTGDNRLGGEDFNQALANLMAAADKRLAAGLQGDRQLSAKLMEAAERARRALTSASSTTMTLSWQGEQFAHDVTAEGFESAAQPLLDRMRNPVLRALRDADIAPDSLSEIILIGGATRMPIVRRTVAKMFGRFPNASINPDEAVALGAAVQAGLKARDAALKEVVVTDVCPYSLGVNIAERLPGGAIEEGIFSPIIERNTTVPVSRVNIYETMSANQKQIVLGIYQGEARRVADNVRIGELKVPMPRGPEGQPIEVRFSYDINGLLEVDVHVIPTGERHNLVIADPEDQVSPAEMERRRAALALLKQHPRDSEANRAALARAERLWEDALGDERDWIGRLIQQFQGALATQDVRVADTARDELMAALDQIDGPRWL
ncbi:molecular chaperone HscC [Sandarakinorhabdus cyanobacteriorum]|uniref:Molecular chaperone HscC n=1 Tax=Sandarakinorhabdus cyanobacteriorum TaxID=1981098 RepID=A0A255YAH8_9SPHN|nr:molecular chaperone HscC [Sandarakinorhabdus cyanobacteriorum]OYQ25645.1 molecular chaperone HscC [Sandarakinorhabdus cyanobacteriorum]